MPTVDLKYSPRKWQRKCHANRSRFRVFALHRRAGKALDVNTLIPMASGGFKRMGDLVAGDRVFDETGTPCNVTYAHDVMFNRECYEIKFSDGATIVADADHLWYTETRLDRTYRKGRVTVDKKMSSGIQQRRKGTTKTTKEILDTLHYCGENNHSIPLSGAVQFEEAELPIPAYIFGAWLGDGHSETARIEVIKRFSDYAETIGAKFRVISCNYGSKAKTYSISGGENLHIKLKSLGVLKNKHIPEIYLLASIEQRKELLRGLMDTDGCIDAKKPCCEIIQKRKSLALEIMRVIRSLGMVCSLSEKIVKERSYWRITFRANFNCFTIKRKSDRYKEQKKNNASASRFIVSVTPVVTRPVRCITVDSQSHLYLASESFVPTHNSTMATMELIDSALKFKLELGLFVYIAPFLSQAKAIAWGMIKFRLKEMIELGAVHVNEAELTITIKSNSARIKLYGADNPDSLRGVRLDGSVLDEVGQMKPMIWDEIIQPALSDRKGWAIFIGTPSGINLFSEKFFKAKTLEGWSSDLFTVYDTEAIDAEEVERLKRDMSTTSFAREFLCDFSAAGEDQLISLEEVELGSKRVLKEGSCDYAPRILGVDPARFGNDSSVIMRRQGFQCFEPIAFQGMDNMELANQVVYWINEWEPDAVFVDAGGGAGIIDRIRQLGHEVIEVPFAGKSGDPKCANKRAEMWVLVRDWLREGGAIPSHSRLKQDLATPRYWFDKFNRIILEPKDDIKARGLPSSDFGDSLALTFAHPVSIKGRAKKFGKQKAGFTAAYDPLDSKYILEH